MAPRDRDVGEDSTGVSMETRLHRQCLEVLHAKTVRDFVRLSAEFGYSMGVQSMAALVATVHSPALAEARSATSTPPEYLPIFEDQDAYAHAGQADLRDEQASFGLRSGVGAAFHLPRGRHLVLGFQSERRACCDKKARSGVTLGVQEFAAHAQAAAFDLCTPCAPSADDAIPAPSELEALRRSMDGLSDQDVGNAMGISGKDVLLRLQRATAKLGCATKHEAARRAIRPGLVACG